VSGTVVLFRPFLLKERLGLAVADLLPPSRSTGLLGA
jgi:hypothetical protein